ncbi:beta-ketoacyl synthase N-terminal-like domain-containing protein [Micromonospora globbae]|uniref:beta-ketoacyl synthase N-terminal-like domain-containing protein n=1 Tax=Micromonospora globbae TaxID=1894969 RepID=UPI003439802D
MPATITASAVRTCFGDGPATWAALLRGDCGVAPLERATAEQVGVGSGYPIADGGSFRPSRWLADCVREALAAAGVDPRRQRVVSLVGTGLRESAEVERAALAGVVDFPAERLHFGGAVAAAAHGVERVVTLANACSAGGHALALAQDLVETGDADAVLVGGTDGSTASMLAMIGRVASRPTERVRPFDADRAGVLLGDGAAVLVVERERGDGGLARLLATGLSCDAGHETAPDPEGILRAVRDAHERAGRRPDQIDLVLAHGTGTALNDATEAHVLAEVFAGCAPGPLVTAVKGAVGHTSGGSALLSVAVAVEALRTGHVPPIAGLARPAPEAAGLRLVRGEAVRADPRVAQVDAFGFGGLNAVTLLEAVR